MQKILFGSVNASFTRSNEIYSLKGTLTGPDQKRLEGLTTKPGSHEFEMGFTFLDDGIIRYRRNGETQTPSTKREILLLKEFIKKVATSEERSVLLNAALAKTALNAITANFNNAREALKFALQQLPD